MKRTKILVTATAALLAATASGCGAHGANSAAPTAIQQPSTPVETVPTQQTPSSNTGTGDSGPASTHPNTAGTQPHSTDTFCRANELRASLVYEGAGAGSKDEALVLTNTGQRACVLQGFPGVSYVTGDDGHQVGKAAFRAGSKGEAFPLPPGQQASAMLRMANVDNFDPGTCQPTDVRGLRVYPPQSYDSLFVPVSNTQGCSSESIPGEQLEIQTLHRGVPTGH